MNKFYFLLSALLVFSITLSAQTSDVQSVTLVFTPMGGGTPVGVAATDNGNGLEVSGPANLMESTEYILTAAVTTASGEVENELITASENYQFFFETTGSVYAGDVETIDTDSQGLPLGVTNEVTSECTEDGNVSGMMRVVLVDFMGMKTASSTINDGTSIFDVDFPVNVMDDPDAPPCENEEEIITDVVLTFTPVDGGDPVVATAQDPDGEGALELEVSGPIELLESTEYTLAITLTNAIEGEDITEEIMEEDDEHMFFFAFTDEVFVSPAGDGNVDNRPDPVNYLDFDENDLPVGLSTSWTTECGEESSTGTFQVILKHQPGVKDEDSTVDDGGTDVDLTWTVNVNEDPDAPPCENEEEIITDVVLTFTPVDGGDPVVATAQDPDGEGALELQVDGPIELLESTEYTLAITLTNAIEGEDITEEIMEEDDEHMFFFAFTDEVFVSPAGDGNVDNRPDPVNYLDFDENDLPVGLSTSWETECGEESSTGTFQVILKHQPGIKDEDSTVDDGGTDVDLTWVVNVNEDPDAPPCENEEEIITDVVLTFTPVDGGDPVIATAQDPDGEGALELEVDGPIELLESTEYTLAITLTNAIEGEDITEEIMEEDDEHMFFFAFTDEVFVSPAGDGNVDNRPDPVNYNDFDENDLPVGLSTSWETECGEESSTGTFQVILKHQPGIKDENSTVDDGGTDVDLTWTVNVNEDPDAPPCENEEEIITDVVLTFTPTGGGPDVVATAQDPDGEGALPLEPQNDIELAVGTEYTLAITLANSIEGEDITEEIMEEDDEHMFFFGFTDAVFSDPTGDGNIDNRPDPVNYIDFDENNLPVGLSTRWTTEVDPNTGTFQLILKHQPGIKDEDSTVDDGGTDVDITWNVNNMVVSVEDLQAELRRQLVLAPNPVNEQLNWRITGEGIDTPVSINILTLTGQLVQTHNATHTQIDVSTLPAGSYIFQLQTEETSVSKRFVKM